MLDTCSVCVCVLPKHCIIPACGGGFKAVLGGGVGGMSFFVTGGRGGMAGASSGPGGWGAGRIFGNKK